MTSVIKRILSTFVAIAMLLSMTAFVGAAEETTVVSAKAEPTMRFTVGEADENGVFQAKLTVHNTQFLVVGFFCSFNQEVIQLVNESGEPSEKLDEVVTAYPAVIDGAAVSFTPVQQKVSNQTGEIDIAAYLLAAGKSTNVVVADEEGFLAYDFRFKKIADGDYGFALRETSLTSSGKGATLNDGKQTLDINFEFVYPEADKNTSEWVEQPEQTTPSGGQSSNDTLSKAERLREERKAGTLVLQINNYAVSLNGVLKLVDKDNKNVVPYIEDDRTMVPLRFISEAFGAQVTWDAETRAVGIELDATKITMQIDNQSYTINGGKVDMDVAPVIREDRTFVPLRFVSEALSKSVYWNGTTRVVVIAPIDKPWDDKDPITQQLMMDTLMMFQWLRNEV